MKRAFQYVAHYSSANQEFADASVRRYEQKGVLRAGVPSPFSPIPLPFFPSSLSPTHYPFRRVLRRLILHQLIRSLTFSNSSAFQRSLFSAMFLVAFYRLFRIGELPSKSTRFARSVVQYSNLTFLFRQGQVQGAKITITKYKHNASRRPFDILLAKDVSSPFCPVTALYQYCNIGGKSSRATFLSR